MSIIILNKPAFTIRGERASYNEEIFVNSDNIKLFEHNTAGEEKSRVKFIDGTDMIVLETPRDIIDLIKSN